MSALPKSGKPKLTLKQERFIKELPTADSLADAAIKAGYDCTRESATVIACQNLGKLSIQQGLEAQQAEIQARHELTQDSIIQELQDAKEESRKKGNTSAMVAAILGKAKVAGLLIDKHEDVTNRPPAEVIDSILDNPEAVRAIRERYRVRVESGESLEPLF